MMIRRILVLALAAWIFSPMGQRVLMSPGPSLMIRRVAPILIVLLPLVVVLLKRTIALEGMKGVRQAERIRDLTRKPWIGAGVGLGIVLLAQMWRAPMSGFAGVWASLLLYSLYACPLLQAKNPSAGGDAFMPQTTRAASLEPRPVAGALPRWAWFLGLGVWSALALVCLLLLASVRSGPRIEDTLGFLFGPHYHSLLHPERCAGGSRVPNRWTRQGPQRYLTPMRSSAAPRLGPASGSPSFGCCSNHGSRVCLGIWLARRPSWHSGHTRGGRYHVHSHAGVHARAAEGRSALAGIGCKSRSYFEGVGGDRLPLLVPVVMRGSVGVVALAAKVGPANGCIHIRAVDPPARGKRPQMPFATSPRSGPPSGSGANRSRGYVPFRPKQDTPVRDSILTAGRDPPTIGDNNRGVEQPGSSSGS